MSKNLTNSKVGSILIYMLGILLVACEPLAVANAGSCSKADAEDNVYIEKISSDIEGSYLSLFSQDGAYNSDALPNAALRAFEMLVSQVKRWSSSVDIPTNDQHVIRITVTYLSPELLYTILLNTQLEYQPGVPLDQFKKTTKDRMDALAKRSELIFLVTISSSISEKSLSEDKMLILNFPAKDIMLINSADERINVSHFDPPLGQEIIISRAHLSGYIAYPMGLKEGENCVNCIDTSWNTMITLSANGLKTNKFEYPHQLNWIIKYHPLIEPQANVGLPQPSFTLAENIALILTPPRPAWNVAAEEADPIYWEEMARYIWGYVIDP
ncbi:MAG: hypothetical protein ACOYYJ_04585 [Chloroflexota bacterium]